jgi:hypothetical protein
MSNHSSHELPPNVAPNTVQSSEEKPKKSTVKTASIVGGAVLIIIIIALGAYAGMKAKKGELPLSGDMSRGIYGDLPGAGDKAAPTPEAVARETSGLSGMPCEHPNRRAIGVMLAGDPINRPMSGFSKADMVFELPVLVSDVTRLTGIYQCGEPTDIGSVRSVRHDYLFMIEGIDGIMAHWGGSYHALNRIAAGEFQTINALTNPFNAFFRKNTLPAPYNGFTTYERLWNALEKLGYRTTTNFKGYEFKDDVEIASRPAGGTLSIGWPGQFRVSYEYNPTTNRYDRYWAGVKQVDAEDGKQVAPSVVAVMRATNQYADGPGGYNDMAIEGKGELMVYQDGKEIKGTWVKNELEKKDPVHFLNEQGQPIVFTRGQVWVTAVEPTITVSWQPK